MSKESIFNVNASSIIDLRAELLRKQQEVQNKKVDSDKYSSTCQESDPYLSISKGSSKSLKLKGQKIEKSIENPSSLVRKKTTIEHEEQQKLLSASSQMLAKKAKLYDQLDKGHKFLNTDDNEDLLVNFNDRHRRKTDLEDDSDEEEEMVEYEDEFGRTRWIPKKDLPKKDDKSQKNPYSAYEQDSKELQSEDMRMENERREWENNAQSSKQTVYYQDVIHKEIRDHGAAFFAFSSDDQTRAEQMEVFKKLRQETQDKRQLAQKIKEKREQQMNTRLAKIAARKGIKFEPKKVEEKEEVVAESSEITIQKASANLVNNHSSRFQTRLWDIGKEGVDSKPDYLTVQREERNFEFAPPSIYQSGESSNNRKFAGTSDQKWRHGDKRKRVEPEDEPTSARESNLDIDDISSFIGSIRKNQTNDGSL